MLNYAQISWTPLDVQSVKPTWPLDKCESWLKENQKYIQDRLIEVGHEIISDLILVRPGETSELEKFLTFMESDKCGQCGFEWKTLAKKLRKLVKQDKEKE